MVKGGLAWLCLLVLPVMQVHGDTLKILNTEQRALYDQAVRQNSIDSLLAMIAGHIFMVAHHRRSSTHTDVLPRMWR